MRGSGSQHGRVQRWRSLGGPVLGPEGPVWPGLALGREVSAGGSPAAAVKAPPLSSLPAWAVVPPGSASSRMPHRAGTIPDPPSRVRSLARYPSAS